MPTDHTSPRWSVRSQLAQAMGRIDAATRAVTAPLHLSTTYVRDPDNQYRSSFVYGRPDNATVREAEEVIAMLEGAAGALVFGSGMSAATALFLSLAPGEHVVAPQVMYWALRNWLKVDAAAWGLTVDFVDATDPDAIARAVKPGVTKCVWLETPCNPTWEVSDIAAAADIAHRAEAILAVDSTVATPLLTQPLSLGADVVMHSATKYLNGHSDVIAGALASARDDERWAKVKRVRATLGQILGPFEAYLLLRGMRTLEARLRLQCQSAMTIARHFSTHPRVAEVLYPGLASHPGHALAARQMQGGFGGMLSIRVRAGEQAAIEAAARVQLWKRATSLGGVESLIEHRASIEGPGTPCPPDLLRLSVGLESADDLIADLDRALQGNE
ncbi:MAG: aminotransferase class I/II-fold pyridoxal phosphate-dependent enzyme [Methylobacteriaceae bacterium]|nr:aminotransferase class I/II-fold pyridoxal phosphate-dependent enzyme [Methylobacteriaceae bacterium]